MIIHKLIGPSFIKPALRGVINFQNIFLSISVIAALTFYLLGLAFFAFILSVWILFLSVVFYSMWSRARISYLETTPDGLVLVYSKFFKVKQLLIPYSEVLVEQYVASGYSQGRDTHWLYFNWIGKPRFEAEVSGGFYTTGKILAILSEDGRIQLGEKELGVVRKYNSRVAEKKIPDTKSGLIIVFLIFLGMIAYALYKMYWE